VKIKRERLEENGIVEGCSFSRGEMGEKKKEEIRKEREREREREKEKEISLFFREVARARAPTFTL